MQKLVAQLVILCTPTVCRATQACSDIQSLMTNG